MNAPQKRDETLEFTIGALRKALDGLPHGTAKAISGPIEELISEARWLNVQRDWARSERDAAQAKLNPQG